MAEDGYGCLECVAPTFQIETGEAVIAGYDKHTHHMELCRRQSK